MSWESPINVGEKCKVDHPERQAGVIYTTITPQPSSGGDSSNEDLLLEFQYSNQRKWEKVGNRLGETVGKYFREL